MAERREESEDEGEEGREDERVLDILGRERVRKAEANLKLEGRKPKRRMKKLLRKVFFCKMDIGLCKLIFAN